jgi:hypothetical protein
LTRALVLAHAGEWGAIRAYLGHHASLPPGPDRAAIRVILVDEIRHRHVLRAMLAELGAAPDPRRERKLDVIGRAIAAFCRVGGWFFPMYGAARLERDNVGEYEIAARLASYAGRHEWIDTLLHLAEVEWDHERVLRDASSRHPLWRRVPRWESPPRAAIRERFAAFLRAPRRPTPRRSWLVR